MIEIIIGVVAGTLGVGGFIWQTYKNPFGMTYPMILFVGISLTLWASYGLAIGNMIIWIPNAIMIGLLFLTSCRKINQDKEIFN